MIWYFAIKKRRYVESVDFCKNCKNKFQLIESQIKIVFESISQFLWLIDWSIDWLIINSEMNEKL